MKACYFQNGEPLFPNKEWLLSTANWWRLTEGIAPGGATGQ
jgi:hypothetical protein